MNPSISIQQNYVTPLRAISRETEPSSDPEDQLFSVRLPPANGERKFSNICIEDIENHIENETCL